MSKMSFHLAEALRSGRRASAKPPSREAILARLLNKRAAAARAGLTDLEKQLRNQIGWALPIRRPADDEPKDVLLDAPGGGSECGASPEA